MACPSQTNVGQVRQLSDDMPEDRQNSLASSTKSPQISIRVDDTVEIEGALEKHEPQTPVFTPPSRAILQSSNTQLIILAIVTLCGPGMFSALNGLGGAGLSDPVAVNNSLVANYGSSSMVGFIAGPIVNRLGYRLSLLIGATAFTLYPICLLIYFITRHDWVLIMGGTISGVLCSIEWTALGAMLMTYPSPQSKGKHVSLNIAAFNFGAIIGSMMVFLQNLNSAAISVSLETYIAFIAVMFAGAPLSLLVVNTTTVKTSEGATPPLPPKAPWSNAYKAIYRRLRKDTYIITLFPLMFVSNYYLPYEFNDINLTRFNVRTRALNVILFYVGGILGAYSAGFTLDIKAAGRRSKVVMAILALLTTSSAVFTGAYLWHGSISRSSTEQADFYRIDCTETAYIAPLFLYLGFGFAHFVLQNCIYWFISILSEDAESGASSDFAGFFKSLQAAGAAVSWRLSNERFAFNTNLVSAWVMVAVSVLVAMPMLLKKIRESG